MSRSISRPRCSLPSALIVAALIVVAPGLAGCADRGPKPADAAEACARGRVEEGFSLIKEIARIDTPAELDTPTVVTCLEASLMAAEDGDQWSSLSNHLAVIDQLNVALMTSDLESAVAAARAGVAYARVTGRLCCLEDGLKEFDALSSRAAPAAGDPMQMELDHWYELAREERIHAGEWVVEVGARVVFAPGMADVVPMRDDPRFSEWLDQPVTLHNALIQAETHGEPRRVSGAPLAVRVGDGEPGAHRTWLIRRPGEIDGTVTAVAWDEHWQALLDDLQPGVLHTCEARIVDARGGEGPVGPLVVQACRAEPDRTEALFRKRVCTVCGVRDEREVCHVGFGRSDTQAAAQAKEHVCKDLLQFHESPAACGSLVNMQRSCGPNAISDGSDDAR